MKTYFPVANVQVPGGGIIVLTDGEGSFLVQDVDSKFITETNDEHDIGDYLVRELMVHGFNKMFASEPDIPEQAENVTVTHGPPPTKQGWRIEKHDVVSSFIKMLGYDNRFGSLTVYMHDGTWYCYENVPRSELEALLEVNNGGRSVGQYYNQNIKGQYAVSVYDDEPEPDY